MSHTYYITCIQKNFPHETRITQVGAFQYNQATNQLINFQYFSREQVVDLILHHSNQFFTATRLPNDTYQQGQQVQVYQLEQEFFLKTIPNNIPGDNLGELPNC